MHSIICLLLLLFAPAPKYNSIPEKLTYSPLGFGRVTKVTLSYHFSEENFYIERIVISFFSGKEVYYPEKKVLYIQQDEVVGPLLYNDWSERMSYGLGMIKFGEVDFHLSQAFSYDD